MAGSMAFSLIFNVLDSATAPIKGIASALAEPAQAAAAVGEAGDQAATRLGKGMERAEKSVRSLGDRVHGAIGRMAALGRAAGETSEKFARSYGGLGAMVAEGLSIKDVAGQDEYWQRMKINTGMADEAVGGLRDTLHAASQEFGVGQATMMEAYRAFRANGGTSEMFEANNRTIAATLQLLGGNAEETGKMFSVLQTKMHMTDTGEVADTVALLRRQLAGIEGGVPAFAEAFDRLGDSMEQLGMKGHGAVASLGAVYAVATKGAGGNARKAIAATEGWLHDLTDRGYQAQLSQGLGERITDDNGRVKDIRLLMQKMTGKYVEAMRLPENQQVAAIARLDALFGDSGARMFKAVAGEVKATGRSDTMDRILAAQGDGADMMDRATRASRTLSGSMNRLRDSMARAAESVFTTPVRLFADAMAAGSGAVGKIVLALAAFATIGHAIRWIAGAVEGIRLLTGVLGLARLTALIPATGAIGTFSAALAACPVTWIVAGIAAIAGGAYLIYRNWGQIGAWWGAKMDAVKTAFDQSWTDGIVKVLVEFNPWTLVAEAWDGLVKNLFGIDLAEAGRNLIDSLIRGVKEKLPDLPAPLRDMLGLNDGGTATEKAAGPSKGSGASPPREGVKARAQSAVAAVKRTGAEAWSSVKSVAGAAYDAAAHSDIVKNAVAFFEGKGWTHAQAAGIAANLGQESKFNAGAVGDRGQAYGLAQWHPDRQAAFATRFGHDIRLSSHEEQMAFVDYELRGAERRAGLALAGADSAADAGAIISKLYERPADREGEATRRALAAEAIAAATPAAIGPQPLTATAASPAGAPVGGENVIVVRFEGLPPGATPRVSSQSGNLALRLDRGPSMMAG
ncbi:MAG: hypothetical protein RLZZ501_13 [Pseudomonadota bacterium]|jgi:hypothetical protein